MMMSLPRVAIIALICTLMCSYGSSMTLDEIRRSIPKGATLYSYAGTCEACGEFYGSSYTYRCLTDKTFETYHKCNIAVNEKRK
ncbi:Hypothetical predicted protein [Octopus vulgaris]|nr:Hypothetical predicted protein [Octopus vulgaris]